MGHKHSQLLAASALCLGLVGATFPSHAETTTTEKAGEVVQDAAKSTRKTYRKAKDKACEMVNGELKCLDEKANSAKENMKDEVKDKADDVKKKID